MGRYWGVAAVLLLAGAPGAWAGAEVFRCQKDGVTVFTDKPCTDNAQTYAPRVPLVVVPRAAKAPDLAKQYDQRVQRETQQRDKADAAWSKDYEKRKQHDARLEKARAQGTVGVGMDQHEARSKLGEPTFTSHNENAGVTRDAWTYKHPDGSRTIVRFKDGVVTEVSTSRGRRK